MYGKSSIFNALTGMHQHTGNWPGKTVANASGTYTYQNKDSIKEVQLPCVEQPAVFLMRHIEFPADGSQLLLCRLSISKPELRETFLGDAHLLVELSGRLEILRIAKFNTK